MTVDPTSSSYRPDGTSDRLLPQPPVSPAAGADPLAAPPYAAAPGAAAPDGGALDGGALDGGVFDGAAGHQPRPIFDAQQDGRRRATIGKAAGGAAGGLGLIVKFWAGFKGLVFLLKFKTLLTMFISVVAYSLFWGWKFALGFVVLLFIHEMGHVVVLRHQGVKASAPMFIPFLGAFVSLKQAQRSVAEEATSALAGPAAGLLASGAVMFAADVTGSALLRGLAYSGFLLNLFNLLPALPLDGGRVAGALHPAIWFAGIGGALVLIYYFHSPVLILVLILGVFELINRWRARRRGESGAYFAISQQTRWAIGGAYVLVAVLCVAGMAVTYAPMAMG